MTETYDQWVESLGLPIHKGYYIEDLRKVELGWWEEKGCNAAFIQLVGFEGIAETKVTGIPPGKTTLPWRFALDEIFYVVEGRGLATVWGAEHSARKTFEWQKHSLFVIPRQSFYQLSNAQGDKPATLISYNHLPLAMWAVGDPEFFFNNPYVSKQGNALEDFYSEAKGDLSEEKGRPYLGNRYERYGSRFLAWYGNFFPDMGAWDKLDQFKFRGAGGSVVWIIYPNSWPNFAHMSVFPARTYKKAHYHGPGAFILIPAGEGYSVMWEKGHEVGKEGIIAPWNEGSCFGPQMYHQHFNVGSTPARYLVLQTVGRPGRSERDLEQGTNQIEYPDEDPWIRQTFEKELARRGLTSLMDEKAYKDRNYKWGYTEDLV